MSDVQQGPEWWMASDGKWYPPSARPAPPSPPPPPGPPGPPPGFATPTAPPPGAPGAGAGPGWAPAPGAFGPTSPPGFPGAGPAWSPGGPPVAMAGGPVRVSSGLSGTLQGFFWASGAVILIAALLTFTARSSYAGLADGDLDNFISWVDQHDAMQALMGLSYLLWLVVFILLLIWMFKAHRVSKTRNPGPRTWATGWTIGAWFIPVANLILPRLVFAEMDRIAASPATTGGPADPWAGAQHTGGSTSSPAGLGWAWWIVLIVGLVTTTVGIGMLGSDEDLLFNSTEDDILQGYLVQGIGLLVWAVSCVLGALYVRTLSRRLNSPS